MKRLRDALQQLAFLAHETRRMNGDKWWRWGSVWFTESFTVLASYRLSRSGYLAFGKRGWPVVRIALGPLLFATRPWFSTCEIHYTADIGKGLRVLHPSLGVVVSGYTVAGENLTLVGGNCIGTRKRAGFGDILLGDNVMLGANAVVLGPVQVGDRAQIGAGALVVHDVPADAIALAPEADLRGRRPRVVGR